MQMKALAIWRRKIFSPDISERSENSQQAIEVGVHERDKKKIQ